MAKTTKKRVDWVVEHNVLGVGNQVISTFRLFGTEATPMGAAGSARNALSHLTATENGTAAKPESGSKKATAREADLAK